jgi:predicted HicB family RNase H-like nuclease
VFHGKIRGINDWVTFEGNSLKELKIAFKDAVEDYLITCKTLGKQAENTFKGSFNIKIPMQLHRKAAIIAAQSQLTLNEFMKLAISFAIQHEHEMHKEIRRYQEA